MNVIPQLSMNISIFFNETKTNARGDKWFSKGPTAVILTDLALELRKKDYSPNCGPRLLIP